ncbi:MAG: BON domain-containing protein [Bryobacteraceae bacterium]|nr:BON domain-containing protein [Bryobacteraceae bacterium]
MIRSKLAIAMVMAAVPALLSAANGAQPAKPLAEQVRHELITLPFLSIYDSLRFQVDGDRVILSGETIRPVMKSQAENVVKQLAGVSTVVNNIEVLPLSPYDDRVRIAVARAVYGFPALLRYSLGALPSIHIVVKNGNVTLKGVVATEMDRTLAFLRANGVPGTFQVTNELVVAGQRPL